MNIRAPVRVRHRYVQQLCASPSVVFPLLCPVREVEWVEGWQPHAVYSHSGVAEPDCVFTTPEEGEEAVWVVTTHDPEHHRIAFVKVVPGVMVTQINIALQENEPGQSEAEVCYAYTALSAKGEAAVSQMTPQAYEQFMHRWEAALNDYLRRSPTTPTSIPKT